MEPVELIFFAAMISLAVLGWLAFGYAYKLGFRPFGPQRNRAVPWPGRDLVLLAPMVIAGILRGLLSDEKLEDHAAFAGLTMLAIVSVLVLPFHVLVVRGARLYQLGLHVSHFRRNALVGFGTFWLSAPLVAVTNLLALQFFERRAHSIEQAIRESPTLTNFLLSGIGAILIAPFIEELTFRGILQPWLSRALGRVPGICLSSAIFAVAHADAWPAPLALFVFAIFLGYLANRTSSLVGSIVLHATFNAANMMILALAVYFGELPPM